MRITIRNQKDFGAALLFALVGAVVLYNSWDYQFGTMRALGPGAFPKVLGWFLVGLGAVLMAGSLNKDGERMEAFSVANLVTVIGALVLFGLTLNQVGVLIGSFALVFAVGVLTRQLTALQAAVCATLMAIFVSVVFVRILGLQMPVLGSWFV